jgi:hypothetical protein
LRPQRDAGDFGGGPAGIRLRQHAHLDERPIDGARN